MFGPVFSPKELKGKFCSEPWNTLNIISTGSVFSCTCANWTNMEIGNLLRESLADIYARSPQLKKIRDTTLDGTFGWCVETDCVKLTMLQDYKDDPFSELGVNRHAHLPTNLSLAIDRNCNLKCPSCRAARIFNSRSDANVEIMLNKLSDEYRDFDQPVMVMLDGDGDVFVSQAYHDFLFNGKLPACWKLMITTNGNLITKKKSEIASIADRIDIVIVSLDAATAGTYDVIRGGNFDVVMDGIKALLDMGITPYLQFVLQAANYKELLGYKAIADSFNIGYGVQKIDRRRHMTAQYWRETNIEDNPNIDMDLLKAQLLVLSADRNCNLDGGIRWLLARL